MEIVRKVSKMNKGIFGVEIVTETEPVMRKTNNPFVGRVRKVTTYTNAILGVNYQNVVNNRLERNGLERSYQSEAPKGKKFYNAFFYQSLDGNSFYLKIGMYHNTTTTAKYIIDGHEASQSEIEALKAFLKPHSTIIKKQSDAGLPDTQNYPIVAPNAANVISIKLGERIIYQRD